MNSNAPGDRLHDAVVEAAQEQGANGVITDWVVVYATHRYDEDGDTVNEVGRLIPSASGGLPFHRLLGLLDYELTRARAQITAEED